MLWRRRALEPARAMATEAQPSDPPASGIQHGVGDKAGEPSIQPVGHVTPAVE
jgi:hypothetical protein